ncbi:hypothetical protein FJT64_003172 [Amphibalanus amphitrite]|uniref:Uncharacterized protein n=1 Tax=Amphibalanus amphitrite TaxID=1232801 RepID=A0A6A4WC65_AMPAM|nr:hypothetical protein FJT64_003172 [Amphibalanus amphitrite]
MKRLQAMATVGEVALRLTKVRQTFETLRAEVADVQRERQQCVDQLNTELDQFSELFDRLTARVGPVPPLDPPADR